MVIRLTSDSDGPDLPTAQLSSGNDDGVASLELPLDGKHLKAVSGGRWQTKQLPTSTHSMIAVTWAAASATGLSWSSMFAPTTPTPIALRTVSAASP